MRLKTTKQKRIHKKLLCTLFVLVVLAFTIVIYSINNLTIAVVLSDSMKPTFVAGDIIVSQKITFENVNIGDVISFEANKEIPITHRVIKIEEKSFITKGDAVSIESTEIVEKSSVISKYIFRVPFAGYLINWISSPLGFLFFYVLPINYIGYLIVRKIIYSRKTHKRYIPEVF